MKNQHPEMTQNQPFQIAHINRIGDGRRKTVSVTSEEVSVQELAASLGLKEITSGGQSEYHGANPFEEGATHDGFMLNANGTAYDRKTNRRYTSWDVARLAGLKAISYEPCHEFLKMRGTRRHATSNAARTGQDNGQGERR